jgi:hypothetical protein
MSTVISISTRRRYGVARVCRVWGFARAGVYRRRGAAEAPLAPRRRPGPQGAMSDAALAEAIRRVLTDSPFHGDGVRRKKRGVQWTARPPNARSGRGCAMRACAPRRSACAA